MPYNSIADLPAQFQSLPSHAKDIALAAFNSAYSGTCNSDEQCAFRIAWAAVKKSYRKVGGEWIAAATGDLQEFKILSAAGETTDKKFIISGKLIELDVLNKRNWGITQPEAAGAIGSLIGVPLKICSGGKAVWDEHSCDYDWNPKDNIGKIIAANRDANWITVTAEVTDSIAKQKITEGSWKPNWSVFMSHSSPQSKGFVSTPRAKSVTLVNFPAYPEAGFEIAASEGIMDENQLGSAADMTAAEINNLPDSAFALVENCYGKTSDDKNARHLPHHNADGSINLPHLRNALARVNQIKPVCPNENQADMVATARAHLEKHRHLLETAGASIDSHEMTGDKYMGNPDEEKVHSKKDVDALVAAALDKQKADNEKIMNDKLAEMKAEHEKVVASMMPKTDIEKLVAAAVTKSTDELKEQTARETIADKICEMQVAAGIIKEDEIKATKDKLILKAASTLNDDLEIIQRFISTLDTARVAAGQPAINKFKAASIPAKTDAITESGKRLDAALKSINSKFLGNVKAV